MKTSIALVAWLVTGSYAWAADTPDSPPASEQSPLNWLSTASPAGASTTPLASDASGSAGEAAGQGSKTQSTSAQSLPPPSGNDPLPPPSSDLYNAAQDSVSPLTPEEVRQLRGRMTEINQAMIAPQVAVVPKISALTVDLAPGASLPLVRTAVNYPSSISFIDSTGAPWKLGAAPVVGNASFTAYWLPNSPVMVVHASRPYVSGNVTVYLEGLSVPLVLNVTSGEPDSSAKTWAVDSRLDLRVPRRGPQAIAGAAPQSRIGLHDSTLQAFLDGIPPKEARRLKTSGAVPDTTVWQLGDNLYIRSRADIRDEFEATLSSADGTHLWKLPVTPYVSFSVMGRTSALTVALE